MIPLKTILSFCSEDLMKVSITKHFCPRSDHTSPPSRPVTSEAPGLAEMMTRLIVVYFR